MYCILYTCREYLKTYRMIFQHVSSIVRKITTVQLWRAYTLLSPALKRLPRWPYGSPIVPIDPVRVFRDGPCVLRPRCVLPRDELGVLRPRCVYSETRCVFALESRNTIAVFPEWRRTHNTVQQIHTDTRQSRVRTASKSMQLISIKIMSTSPERRLPTVCMLRTY